MARRQVVLVFVGLLLAVLIASLDQTVVSMALPAIVGTAAPGDLAAKLDVPEERVRLPLLRLRDAGLVALAGDDGGPAGTGEPTFCVGPGGRPAVDKLAAARHRGLAELLDGWSPERHEEVARLLGRLADEPPREGPEPVLAGAGASRRGGR